MTELGLYDTTGRPPGERIEIIVHSHGITTVFLRTLSNFITSIHPMSTFQLSTFFITSRIVDGSI